MTGRPPARIQSVRTARGGFGRWYRAAITTGRWAVLGAWVLAAVLVTVFVPRSGGGGDTFGELLPPDSEVLQVQQRVLEEFRVPVLSGTTVGVHQPGGLSLLTRADSVLWALGTTQDVLEGPQPPTPGSIRAAPNSSGPRK